MNRHLRRNRRQNRQLSLEQLESRRVLAGNIHAFVSGGSLHLDGDSQANEILIEQFGPKSFTISSRDGTTTINHQAGPLTFNRVSNHVFVNLKGGNDVAELDGADGGALVVKNGLFVDMGWGADQLLMNNVHVLRLHVNMGSGADLINIGDDGNASGVMVTKEAIVLTGSGQDDARIANSIFKRFLNLDMGAQNDSTTIQGTTVRRRSVINGSSGTDTLNRENNHGKLKFFSYETVNNSVQSPAPIPPIAANDTATVTRGQPVTINVAANDTAVSGTINPASIIITQPPAHGTATANANGTVLYTNNGDTSATDTFKYTIKDSNGTTSNAATVTITVNAPLQANNDSGSVTEDATPSTATGNVLTNDTGGTGTKTVSAVNGSAASVGNDVTGAHGTFHINANGTFTYTLNNNDEDVAALNNGQMLTDAMGYTAKAGNETSSATLTITINGHTEFIASADTGNVTEDATPNSATGNVLTNDTGGNGTKTVSAVNGSATNVDADVPGAHGTFHINSNGTFTYTLDNTQAAVNALNNGDTLSDAINYTATDGVSTSSSTLTITINGHTELVAGDDAASVTEDATPNTATGNVLTNDNGGNGTKTVTAVNGAASGVNSDVAGAHGTFHINADGTFTYTLNNSDTVVNALNNGEMLTDTMNYTVGDSVTTDVGALVVTIQGHTELVAGDDTADITEDATPNTVTGDVLGNDVGGNGAKTVTAVNGSAAGVNADVPGAHGTFHINADGTFTYTLNNADTAVNDLDNGETLADTMNYTVGDTVTTDTATLTVTIHGHTELVAGDDTADITEDATPNTVTGDVLGNDAGGNGTKAVTAVNGSAAGVNADVPGTHGTFHINSDGTFTYTLNNADTAVNDLDNGETLTDTMNYTVGDTVTTDTATLTVTIHGHTEFAAVADTGDITEDADPNSTTGNVLTNDTGGTGTNTVTAVNGSAAGVGTDVPGTHGTFHINANGTFTYTLNNADTAVNDLDAGEMLTDSMSYTASDGVVTSSNMLTITIHGSDDLLATDDTNSVTEDSGQPSTTAGNVLDNDTGGPSARTITAVDGQANNVGMDVPGANGFGTFHINPDGTYTYTLDDTNTDVNNLNDGQMLEDFIDYTVSSGLSTDIGRLTITINGHTDGGT